MWGDRRSWFFLQVRADGPVGTKRPTAHRASDLWIGTLRSELAERRFTVVGYPLVGKPTE